MLQPVTSAEARQGAERFGWKIKALGADKWRRVVASPFPISCVEKDIIKLLIDQHIIVIAAGGGGIPVYIDPERGYEGVDAVIDKDRASAVLGQEIGAEILMLLTSVDRVALNFGQADQKELGKVSTSEIRKYFSEGHFPAGSMGPKIEAALDFLAKGGKEVIITSFDLAPDALVGKAGTRIYPD